MKTLVLAGAVFIGGCAQLGVSPWVSSANVAPAQIDADRAECYRQVAAEGVLNVYSMQGAMLETLERVASCMQAKGYVLK